MELVLLMLLSCLGSGTLGKDQKEYNPQFLDSLENHTVTQGRDVSFTCVVNHLGEYKVAWIKSDSKTILALGNHLVAHNSRLSVTHNGHNTWKLKVSNVQKNDSGSYMCQINTDPMISQMGHLEVVIPPDVSDEAPGKDHTTVEGGSLRLSCKATGVPEPRVTWRREDGSSILIRHDSNNKDVLRTFEGETLHLPNVQRSDMGVYLCIASNGVPPSVSKRYPVQIHFHPMVKVSNQLVAAPLGSDVLIQCYVESSPQAMHSWTKENNEKLMDGQKYEIKELAINEYSLYMNLTIKNLEKKDFGSYACSSSNALGKAEGTIRLQELQLPKTTPATTSGQEVGRKKPVSGGGKGGRPPPPPPTKKPRRKYRPEETTTQGTPGSGGEPDLHPPYHLMTAVPPTRTYLFDDEENEIDFRSRASSLPCHSLGISQVFLLLLVLTRLC